MASIHQVILDGRLSQLKILINRICCNVNEKDVYGRTPLHLAVLSNQENYGYKVARLLLQSNADINATDFQQQTPLIYACVLNRSKLIPLFLQTKSINWYHIDYNGYSILHHAASSSQTSILVDIIHEIKSIGLSIDCKTELGYTPLILAIKSLRFDNAIYLLDHTDASPYANDNEYHFTCQQWAQNVGSKLNDYNHIKSLEENTYTPFILSPCNKDRKSIHIEKSNLKSSYQIWMELVQRLHDRTKSCHEKISPWYNDKLNSNKQVITLINHYSNMLATNNNEPCGLRYDDRPRSILRSREPLNKYRFPKEVTFAIN